MRFLVLDDYLSSHSVIEADSMEEAVKKIAAFGFRDQNRTVPQIDKCISPKMVEVSTVHGGLTSLGVRSFVDEATEEGWGKGCKFEGKNPEHQILVSLIPLERN